MKTHSGGHPENVLHEKIFVQKVAKIFQASLGKLGQKSFAPQKIFLLLHLCFFHFLVIAMALSFPVSLPSDNNASLRRAVSLHRIFRK